MWWEAPGGLKVECLLMATLMLIGILNLVLLTIVYMGDYRQF